MALQPYWNPSDKASAVTLSNSDRTASITTVAAGTVYSTVAVSSGKFWVEWEHVTGTQGRYGLSDSATATSSLPGVAAASWCYFALNGRKINNNSTTVYGDALSNGDILAMAVDLAAGKVWWGRNGAWYGDPAAGTGEAFSGLSGSLELCWGSAGVPGTRTGTLLDIASYTFSPPSGFSAGWGSSGPTTYDQALSATLTATATIRKTVQKRLSATLSMVATLARIALRPVALVAGMTMTAAMRREVHKGLSATLSLAATIRKTVGKSLSDTITLTATIAKAFPVHLSASLTASASIAKTVAKRLAASLGLTATLGTIKVAIVAMSATVSLTASLATIRIFQRALSASVTLTASIRKTIAKRLVALQPTLARPIAWIAYQFAAIRNDKPNWNQCPRCARKVRPNKMHQQMEYRGPRLVWTGLYVCSSCLDEPQQQGIWPRDTGGDPKPVILARPRRD